MGAVPTNCCTQEVSGNCEQRFDHVGSYSFPVCCASDECLPQSCTGLNDKQYADIFLVQAVIRSELHSIQRALDLGASVDTHADLRLCSGDVSFGQARGVTPLMRASAQGNQEVVAYLIDRRADLRSTDTQCFTPVCYALAAGELDTAKALLSSCDGEVDEHKLAIHKVKDQVLDQCAEAAGDDIADALRREFAPGGFLAPDNRPV